MAAVWAGYPASWDAPLPWGPPVGPVAAQPDEAQEWWPTQQQSRQLVYEGQPGQKGGEWPAWQEDNQGTRASWAERNPGQGGESEGTRAYRQMARWRICK